MGGNAGHLEQKALLSQGLKVTFLCLFLTNCELLQ